MTRKRLKNNALYKDERGNLAVEVALCAPFLLLLLFGGVALIQWVQLTRTAERTAVLLVEMLADSRELQDTDFDAAALVAERLVGGRGGASALAFHVRAFHQQAAETTLLWERERGEASLGCDLPPRLPDGALGAAPRYLLQLDLCLAPHAGSSVSPLRIVGRSEVSAQKFSIARHAAVRSLE